MIVEIAPGLYRERVWDRYRAVEVLYSHDEDCTNKQAFPGSTHRYCSCMASWGDESL